MDEERIALRFEESGLRRGRDSKLFEKRFPQPNLVRLHYHESLELNICRGIRGRAWVDGKSVDLGTDPVLVLSPRALHSYAIEACSGSMLVLHLSFRALEPWLDGRALAERLSVLPACLPAYRALGPLVVAEFSAAAGDAVRAASGEEAADGDAAACRAAARALGLTAAVIEAAGAERGAEAAKLRVGSLPDAELRSLIALAESRLADPPSLAEAAAAVGRSRSTFCRWFRQRSGATWGAYVESIRLGAARERLADGTPVALAAAETGYDDPSYFVRRFKLRYGRTPGKMARGYP